MKSLNINGVLQSLEKPLIMAVINTTPDSFYTESRIESENRLLDFVATMLEEGATLIDIGGCSSRPNAETITTSEELNRTLWAIAAIKLHFPTAIISIDTYNSEVAKRAVISGASIVNDISGGCIDLKMFETIASLNCPYVLSHYIHSENKINQLFNNPNLLPSMMLFFIEKLNILRKLNVKDIIIDVGFGFSKSLDNSFEVLKNLEIFEQLDLPIMVGLSRKSMIYKTLKCSQENSLNGTTALNMVALSKGANILRVHDIRPANEAVQLWGKII